METISLKKVTVVVTACTVGAFMVNAKEDDKVSVETQKLEQVAHNSQQPIAFKILIEKLDKDANGLLSLEELNADKNELLIKSFKTLDSNKDSNISEAEYNTFVTTAL